MGFVAITISGYEDARQAGARLKVTLQHVYNLNSSRDDSPACLRRSHPLWPVDRLDAWRAAHPKH